MQNSQRPAVLADFKGQENGKGPVVSAAREEFSVYKRLQERRFQHRAELGLQIVHDLVICTR